MDNSWVVNRSRSNMLSRRIVKERGTGHRQRGYWPLKPRRIHWLLVDLQRFHIRVCPPPLFKGWKVDDRRVRWSIIAIPTTATSRLPGPTTTPTTWSSSLSTPSASPTFISTTSSSRLPGTSKWLSGLSTPTTWVPRC